MGIFALCTDTESITERQPLHCARGGSGASPGAFFRFLSWRDKKGIPRSVLQKHPQPLFRAVEGAADGAFVDATLGGDLGLGELPEIIGQEDLPLDLRQLLLDDLFHPLLLDLHGEPHPQVAVIQCISHCDNTPSHNNGP